MSAESEPPPKRPKARDEASRSAATAPRPSRRRRARFAFATLGALWYTLLVVVLPVTTLVVIALVSLWREGQLLALLVGWLAVTLVGYAVFVSLPRHRGARAARELRESRDEDVELPDQLDEKADWSARDSAIWRRRCIAIERTLADAPDWEALPDLVVEELAAVAAEYHGGKREARFRFTLPEALLVTSVASARYRRLVLDHVPFADRVTVASLVSLHRHQTRIVGGVRWLDRARRTLRLANPVGAVVGELRDQFTSRVLGEVGTALQQDLKRLLLQEVAQVAIDLYSGRLRSSEAELAGWRSRADREDETRRVEAVEPLRVVLLGQISAGKSSLVNALVATLEAETDILPTTDRTTVHALEAAGGERLHLVDTPGIDEDPERRRQLVAAAADADLLVWVARATQPARAPDAELHAALERHFAARPERRAPPALLALTHVDRLPPRAEWSPPYDLGRTVGKAATMRAALDAARAAIGFDPDAPAVPLCLDPARGLYNVDAALAAIMTLAEAATLAQMNRRRVERGAEAGDWRARWRQTRGLGRALGRSLARRAEEIVREGVRDDDGAEAVRGDRKDVHAGRD